VDYDDDGTLDFISGSYDPGDVYLFRGLGGGKYADVESILDKSGQPVVHHPQEFAKYTQLQDDPTADENESTMARVASFGSWVAPVDWEKDGDLDLLIGSFGGELFRRMNEGTRSKPAYGIESLPIYVDGKPFKVHSHANPVVADWDGDGKWDLVVSSGDGSVGWYRNVGSQIEPAFESCRRLVAAAAEKIFLEQNLEPDQAPIPGVRAQICVTDYNQDGRLDLILGDYSDIQWTRALDSTEKEELQALEVELKEMVIEIETVRAKMQQQEEEKQEIEAATAGEQEAAEEKAEQLKQEYQDVADRYRKVRAAKKDYFAESRRASFIWLFLRNKSTPSTVGLNTRSASSNLALKTFLAGNGPREGVSDQSPVSVSVSLVPDEPEAGANFKLTVEIKIAAGWHIYAAAPTGSPSRVTEIRVTPTQGIQAVGPWKRPIGHPSVKDLRVEVLKGTIQFERNFQVDDGNSGRQLELEVHYQVCNEQLCLRPMTIKKTVPFKSSK
jgi:hypothetical protein